MLNTYNYKAGNQTTKINAVSGTLVKNHPNSFFIRFNLKSDYGEGVLSENPYIKERKNSTYFLDEVPVIVLQVMIVGEMEVIAEIVRKEGYDIN